MPLLEVGFETSNRYEVTSAGFSVNDHSASESPLRLSLTSASLRELTDMVMSVTRKILDIFRN